MDDLAARLERLEDEREILRTLHAYAHAIDYGDVEGWLDCFTEDASFRVRGLLRYEVRGRDALRELVSRHTHAPEAWHKHVMVEPYVDVSGDGATCRSFFTVLRDDGGVPVLGGFGRYLDRLVREADGRWRFDERTAEVECWRSDLPALVPSAR